MDATLGFSQGSLVGTHSTCEIGVEDVEGPHPGIRPAACQQIDPGPCLIVQDRVDPYLDDYSMVAAPLHAVVFGNNEYVEFPSLRGSANDARCFGGVLAEMGFQCDIQLNLTTSCLDDAITRYVNKTEQVLRSLCERGTRGCFVTCFHY